jgi:hypothetical protein
VTISSVYFFFIVSGGELKTIYASVMRKLSALWNKQQRSTKASDAIQETLNGLFVTDVATRWNSTFRALERVHRFVKDDSAKFLGLYTTLKLTTGKDRVVPPTPREISFIGEYIQVIVVFCLV